MDPVSPDPRILPSPDSIGSIITLRRVTFNRPGASSQGFSVFSIPRFRKGKRRVEDPRAPPGAESLWTPLFSTTEKPYASPFLRAQKKAAFE
jgi:hypothetical protein